MDVGDVVYSLTGRDAGRYFIVVDINDKFVYICNGDIRPLKKPKKKNITHVKAIKKANLEIIDKLKSKKLIDKELREFLNNFNYSTLEGKEV